jgi:hypothetical protein
MGIHETPAQINRPPFSPGSGFQIRPFAGLKLPGLKTSRAGFENPVHLVIINPGMTPQNTFLLAGFQDDPFHFMPPTPV